MSEQHFLTITLMRKKNKGKAADGRIKRWGKAKQTKQAASYVFDGNDLCCCEHIVLFTHFFSLKTNGLGLN